MEGLLCIVVGVGVCIGISILLGKESVVVNGGLALPMEELLLWQPFVISCFYWEFH